MWDGGTQAIVQQQLPDSITDFRSSQATSTKNYQWLALSVFRAVESGDRRLVRAAFSALSRPLRDSLSPARAGRLDVDQQDSDFAYDTLALRAADSDDEPPLPSRSPAWGNARNHSLSVSPRLHRATATATASWELGAQTLADMVRARMKQGLRCWATYARQHRLQDLHSSVLQALHKSVQDVASPAPAAQSAPVPASARSNSHRESLAPPESHRSSALPQVSARSNHSNRSSLPVPGPTPRPSSVGQDTHQPASRQSSPASRQSSKQPHLAQTVAQAVTAQKARRGFLKLQAGAKLAGRKYHGDSLRLRCKERHVRAKERTHGPHHPEVGHALLQLARHHGERGALDQQQAALQRALEAHQKHLEEQQPVVTQPHAISQNVHELQRRVRELEEAEASARRSLEESQASTVESSLQSRRAAAVMGLLEGPTESKQHLSERSTDAVVRELYADQARVAEVIKLASKLWDSGVLSVAPRRPPLLKSSLLLRLADRCYHAAMRDALQFWWRKGSLKKAAEEVTSNGGVWPVPVQKQPEGHGQARAGGVWQDPRHSGVTTPRQAATESSNLDECQRLREELKALQAIVANLEGSAAHDGQLGIGQVWEENNRLRAELQEMREIMAAPTSHRSLEPSPTPAAHSGGGLARAGAPWGEEPALIVEQPDGIQFPAKHGAHSGSDSRRPSFSSKTHHSEQHVQPSSGGSRRPSVETHHQAALDAADEHSHMAPRGQVSLYVKSAHNLKNVETATSEPSALDPFVAARVGNQEFRTKPVSQSASPAWNSQLTFAADLNNVNKRVLLLKVMNHHLFECGECLGSTEVPLMSLKPGKLTARRDSLHDGDGGVLEFDICFKPEKGPEGAHRYEEGRGWTGLEDIVTPRPNDGDCAPTPNGILECRILAGHDFKSIDTDEDYGVCDPFVVARLGNKEFKTKTIYDDQNPVWDMSPFSFKGVDLDDSNLRTLHLKVYNHTVFHKDDCIGFSDVQIPNLEAGKTVRLREALHEGDGGELEFEVCFMPEGEHAASAMVGGSSSGRPSMTASENSRDLPLSGGDTPSRRPSVVSQPQSARASERVTSGLVTNLVGDDAEGLDSQHAAAEKQSARNEGSVTTMQDSGLPTRFTPTSYLGAEAESGDDDDDESEAVDDDELANQLGV